MKLSYLLLVGLLIVTLVAPAVAEAAPAAQEEPLSMAFFVPTMSDSWYVGALEGAKRKAAELGINLQLFDASNNVATQLQQFDTAVAAGVDAIILSGVDPKAMVPSVERASDAGITVVAYDRPLWETPKLKLLLQLDTPNMGVLGGQAIVDQLTKKHGAPKGKVIRVFGDLADTWVTYITEGWDPLMAKYPDIQILTAVSGQWEVETAATNVAQIMTTNPDVDAIFVDSDWLATGIVANLEASGTYGKAGEASHIFFVGVNGSPEALDYIREGWMDVTVSTPVPDLTGAAVDLAAMLVQGKPIPAEYVQQGAAWSPATIYPKPQYGTMPFPLEEKPYQGPVLNMLNEVVNRDNVDSPQLWGNIVGKPTPAAEEEPLSMAFFVPTMSDSWYVGALEGAKRKAAELNINLQVFDASNKVETQLQQFDTAVAAGVDAIILSGVDPKAMVPSVERASDAGIVVVAYDRPLWETPKLKLLLQLDTPNMGVLGGQAIIDQLTKKHGAPKGKVIRVFGDLADTWVTYITEGWDPLMAKYPDIKILTAVSGVWDVATAAANVAQIMTTNPDVDAIFVDSDWLATGIVANLEASGTYGKAGDASHIFFVGVNGSPAALDYIREGWMDVTVSTPVPDLTGAAVDLAAMLVQGKPIPAEYVQQGAAWSPATIYPKPQYGTMPFPLEEKPYQGPVLNMLNEVVNRDNVDSPQLWGNIVGKQ